MFSNQLMHLASVVRAKPQAIAKIKGSSEYSNVYGTAMFFQSQLGVVVFIELFGLPKSTDLCGGKIFGLHIHSGTSCTGDDQDPFSNADGHYNPNGCDHPYHAGDLPPIFGNNGYGVEAFLTNRFKLSEVIGRTIIIHEKQDDFTSQPSGNAGRKIACGKISIA